MYTTTDLNTYEVTVAGGCTFSLTVTSWGGSEGTVTGTFSGVLIKSSGSGAATIDISGGEFISSIQ